MILVLCFGLALVCCEKGNEDTDAAVVNTESAKTAINDAWRKFETDWKNEDVEACAFLYTEDALNMPDGRPESRGREAFAQFYGFLFDRYDFDNVLYKTREIDVCGETAVEIGEFSHDMIEEDMSNFIKQRYVAVWKHQADGSWKIHRFIFNNFPPTE